MPFNLAILNISGGHLSRGYCKYLSNILPLLANSDTISNILVFLPSEIDLGVDHSKISFFVLDQRQSISHQIREELSDFVPGLIFIPTCRLFRFSSVPVVNMIQNMEPFQAPFLCNPISQKIKNLFRVFASITSCLFSDSTIAISFHVKNYLSMLFCFSQRYFPVIYHGVEPVPITRQIRPLSLPKNLSKFIFTGGSIRPARGLEDFILAARILSVSNPDLSFVVAGSVDPGMHNYFNSLEVLVKNASLTDRFIWLGAVDEASMAWCYTNCELFLMTSRTEACPNVVLESLAYGSVVVSTFTDPMPEFYENAAFYYKRSDSLSLKSALDAALSLTSNERAKRQSYAKSLSSRYTWSGCAMSLLRHFELLKA
jgi:glycosyltransferase involved in cell wall biosynthesis